MPEAIVRIAARGEGVSESGKHVPFAVPGDTLLDDGKVQPGPDHQVPPCRHFPECGGCQLQHVSDAAFRDYLVNRIAGALAQHGLEAEIREPHLSPPNSRRRATLKALKTAGGVLIGFNAAKTHRIVDMHENHILCPEMVALIPPLRALLGRLLKPKGGGEIQMTAIDGGIDLLLKGVAADDLRSIELLTSFAMEHRLARLSVDPGLGSETVYEPVPATITLSGVAVAFPVGSFLQATTDGEAALVASVRDALSDAKSVADLFSGLGTFALATRAAYAAEASRNAAASLQGAAPAMKVEHRDLYRRPLDGEEMPRFDGIVLDPPRAGAEQQVRQIAGSAVAKIAFVSCNPATFARDARLLVDGGYKFNWVRPVGQFRWSTHIELAAAFSR